MKKKCFIKNRMTCIGIGILSIIIIFCLLGPFFSPYGEYEIFYINNQTNEEVRMDECKIDAVYIGVNVKAPISFKHWLGTDADGRDVLTRLMYGGRVSLLVGFIVVFIELAIGVTMGGLAGYYGGIIDMVIMRLAEVFNCIPFVPFMLIISAVMFGHGVLPQYRIYFIMIVMGVLYWAGVARIVRGQILSLREMEYMLAAEAIGVKTRGKIFHYLIPNIMPTIILIGAMDIGSVILMESVLSFLGVGVAWPYASWGNMVNAVNQSVILKNYMNIWVPPGICILLTVLAFNFISDGLRDMLDPRKS